MSSIFGESGGQVQGPSSAYSTAGNAGSSDGKPRNIIDPPGELSEVRPPDLKTSEVTVKDKGAGKEPDMNPTWEERVLCLLTDLQREKGFKDLRPKLKDEVYALIEGAPESAHP